MKAFDIQTALSTIKWNEDERHKEIYGSITLRHGLKLDGLSKDDAKAIVTEWFRQHPTQSDNS